jgi:amidase
MIRRKEISSSELLDYFLGAVEEKNAALNAVVTIDEERARKDAVAADEAIARGDAVGPLHGLPITIKDSFETAGLLTTAGSPEFKDHVPTRDADAVAKLRQAGAIVFGKTNLPFMAADIQSYNELFGCSNNPYDLTRTPGGSSGGAAAAVAAGLTSFELGSDIGGSIRTPAHWTGIYGHKPSFGVVPYRGHIPGPPGSVGPTDLTVAGPLARSAEDLALTFEVLAGPNADNEIGWRLELPKPRHQRLSDFRVAVWFDDPAMPIDDSVRTRFEAMIEALRGAGVQVDEKARPDFVLHDLIRVYYQLLMPIMLAGIPDAVLARVEQTANGFDRDDTSDAARLARAPLIRHREWLGQNEVRHRLRAIFQTFFADYDVLLSPVNPVPAIPHDHSPFASRTIEVNGQERSYNDLLGWVAMATTCYLPATVAPIGPTPQGLPVGAQIIGPYLEDRTTIEFSKLLGEVIGGFSPPTA